MSEDERRSKERGQEGRGEGGQCSYSDESTVKLSTTCTARAEQTAQPDTRRGGLLMDKGEAIETPCQALLLTSN